MVEDKDVEIFLKAKKQELATNILQSISAVFLLALVVLEVISPEHGYTVALATISVVFMSAAFGHSRWVTVSRADLIETLEDIFNRDANALRILADKNRSPGPVPRPNNNARQ